MIDEATRSTHASATRRNLLLSLSPTVCRARDAENARARAAGSPSCSPLLHAVALLVFSALDRAVHAHVLEHSASEGAAPCVRIVGGRQGGLGRLGEPWGGVRSVYVGCANEATVDPHGSRRLEWYAGAARAG